MCESPVQITLKTTTTQLTDGGHHLVAFENTTESLAGNDQVCHYGATDRHFVQELSR